MVSTRVKSRLVFNQSALIVEAALAGEGLCWVPADMVDRHIASGRLVAALERSAITFLGYHAYYASRRASPAVGLVVDALRYRPASS